MRVERTGSFLVENVQKVVVFFRDGGEVDGCIRECGVGFCGNLRECWGFAIYIQIGSTGMELKAKNICKKLLNH